ncbi:MAG: hypothetical protein JWN13_3652 [Betaproteobacteria bacterium]|nr:hypothetical protein [Betaproteobacteria bacterium]
MAQTISRREPGVGCAFALRFGVLTCTGQRRAPLTVPGVFHAHTPRIADYTRMGFRCHCSAGRLSRHLPRGRCTQAGTNSKLQPHPRVARSQVANRARRGAKNNDCRAAARGVANDNFSCVRAQFRPRDCVASPPRRCGVTQRLQRGAEPRPKLAKSLVAMTS